jgi:hypothetical protein
LICAFSVSSTTRSNVALLLRLFVALFHHIRVTLLHQLRHPRVERFPLGHLLVDLSLVLRRAHRLQRIRQVIVLHRAELLAPCSDVGDQVAGPGHCFGGGEARAALAHVAGHLRGD